MSWQLNRVIILQAAGSVGKGESGGRTGHWDTLNGR